MRMLAEGVAAEAAQAPACAWGSRCTACSVLPGPGSASKGNSRPWPCSLLAARMAPCSPVLGVSLPCQVSGCPSEGQPVLVQAGGPSSSLLRCRPKPHLQGQWLGLLGRVVPGRLAGLRRLHVLRGWPPALAGRLGRSVLGDRAADWAVRRLRRLAAWVWSARRDVEGQEAGRLTVQACTHPRGCCNLCTSVPCTEVHEDVFCIVSTL